MTVTDERTAPPVASTASNPVATPASKSASSAGRRLVTFAVVAGVVLIAGWGLFLVFEGPVADQWYNVRQRQLASELTAAQDHTGAGAAIAVLQIPKLGTNVVIAEGDAPGQLRSGPGHRIGTPLPGAVGNSVIAGHREGWGGPLSRVGELQEGDLFVVQTQDKDGAPVNGVFTVTSVRTAGSGDVRHLAPTNDRRVTLLTGRGGQFSDDVLVVTGVSGKPGAARAGDPTTRATTPGDSAWRNGDVLLAVVALAAAGALWKLMRRRYHAGAVVAAIAPLLAVGALALLLKLDASLPPLR